MNKLKIAIQKSGRLNKDSLELLGKCGTKTDNYKDQLKASSSNFPIEAGGAPTSLTSLYV